MALIDFGGVKEEVVTRKEFPMVKARRILKDETIAVIGYGVGTRSGIEHEGQRIPGARRPIEGVCQGLGPGAQGRLETGQGFVRHRGGLFAGDGH